MNVNNVVTPRPATRPEPSTRAAARGDERDDVTDVSEQHRPARAQFSALLALLAGAGSTVRADLARQLPADGVSLLDHLLDGTAQEAGALDADSTASGVGARDVMAGLPATSAASQQATDALRYGILKVTGDAEQAAEADILRSALNYAALDNTNGVSGLARTSAGGDPARRNEVIGRIVAGRGTSVDQLKARGEHAAAEIRQALDALLSRAGTPVGLELAGATDPSTLTAAALANAKSAPATDVTTPVRSLDALAPELRQKLARVIERMQNEHGHNVDVVETARTQERQNFLYEQGRSRDGAIVTWTRDSAHTRGDAVDVIVDGTYNNAEGFARLQRIAREEGLRTLGSRDPGHLELESNGRPIDGAASSSVSSRQEQKIASQVAEASQSGLARVANTAGVAGVAGIARVAGVARVAEPGNSRGGERTYAADAELSATNTSAGSASVANANGPAGERGQGNAFGRGERDESGRPRNDGRALGATKRDTLGAAEPAAFGALHNNSAIATPHSTNGTAATAGLDSASRVADLQQLRDSAPAGSVSRMTLNIDAPDGGQDRITIDLRGRSVGTQISTDAGSAEQLRLRTGELQDALGRHGLESESVRISGAARNETVDASRIAGNERDGLRLNAAQHGAANDSATSQGQRERSANARENAREWDRPESSRQSRDEERESARQGAGQRGRRDTPNGSAS